MVSPWICQDMRAQTVNDMELGGPRILERHIHEVGIGPSSPCNT